MMVPFAGCFKKSETKVPVKTSPKSSVSTTKKPRKPRSIGDRARRMRRTIQTRASRLTRNVRGTFDRLRPSNLKQTGSNLLKRAGGLKQNIMQRGGNLFNTVKGRGSKFVQGAIQKGKGALSWADDFVQKQMANIDNVIGGVKEWGKQQGAKIGKNLKSMNPMKLGEKVKGLLKGKIDNILKNNKLVKQVLDIAKNPKKIGDILKSTAKNKNVLKLREGLKAAKKMKIGGVDKVIAAIMGVIDYGLLGESPVNAILRALGGLLGYTAGFAIGAPFGGAPGFITGMAGGFVGEQASRLLAKGLVHVPTPFGKLGTMDDPIAKAIGLSPRKIVRDPDDTAMNDKLNQDQQKLSEERSETKTPPKKPQKIDKIFKSRSGAEYDLSKEMGGLSRKDFDALGNRERTRILQRQSVWQNQNKKEWVDNIKGNGNNIVSTNNSLSNKASSVSSSASYEEGSGKEVVVINPKNNPSTASQSTEEGKVVAIESGSGSGSDATASLYRG